MSSSWFLLRLRSLSVGQRLSSGLDTEREQKTEPGGNRETGKRNREETFVHRKEFDFDLDIFYFN